MRETFMFSTPSWLLISVLFIFSLMPTTLGRVPVQSSRWRRSLMRISEAKRNATFECSPAGPCVACQYSEKNDEKYRCSETGYRIPLKCVEMESDPKSKRPPKRKYLLEDGSLFAPLQQIKWRRLLDNSSKAQSRKKTYITYRSCLPPVDEEKLTVLGFEGMMLGLLLVTAPVVYFRRKRAVNASGAVRIPTNSRF